MAAQRRGEVVAVHRRVTSSTSEARLGQDVAVEHARGVGPALAPDAVGVGVEGEEIPGVPDAGQDRRRTSSNPRARTTRSRPRKHRRRQQEPAHGVGPSVEEHARGRDSCAGAWTSSGRRRPGRCRGPGRSKGGPVEQGGGQHVQRVEPAPGLADVLDDEVAGEMGFEPLRVLERVVHLGEGHRPRFEPAVEDVGHPAHGRARRSGRRGWAGSRSSMAGRCRSVGRTPKSRSSSSRLP